MAESVRLKGFREFQRALAKGDKQTKKLVRDRFKKSGEIVRSEASTQFDHIDSSDAGSFRVAVRTRGVAVEQRRKRTTGKRPDYGALQMRYLSAALDAKQDEVVRDVDKALDDIVNTVEHG